MKKPNGSGLTIDETLKKYWGYNEFRPKQREIIDSVISGQDTLALLPTGGGKSLTYQVPAMVLDGVCIVVTPLIALMKDQVDRLRQLSIPAIAIHSGMSPRQIDIALDNCVYGDTKFLYVSPERVATEIFRYRVQRMNISLIAVDEAHCISQWGYDFRPSYLRIAELREHTNGAPMLALTASATDVVVRDIMTRLKFNSEHIVKGSFTRANLVYAVREVEDKDEQMMKVLNSVEGSGIIYVRTRAGAEDLAQKLLDHNVTSSFYHGGLPHTERAIRQEEWQKGEVRVMVATNAFGMGIDKPDVRFVLHYTMCDSLESYYQEAGRAGRDGKRSYAVLLVEPSDTRKILSRFEMEFPPIEKIKDLYDKICSTLQIGYGEGGMTSHIFNMYEFCSKERVPTRFVESGIKLLEMNGYMSLTDELANPARIMFCVSRDDLYKVRIDHNDLDHFLRVLLRLYEGLFSDFRPIDENEIAHWSGYKPRKVKDLLTRLWRMRLIRYVPSNQSPLICLNEDRAPIADIYISPDTYKFRRELYEERFTHMIAYATNTTRCRSQLFDEYFGVEESAECGVCDICIENRRTQKGAPKIEQIILSALKEREIGIKEFTSKIAAPNARIVQVCEKLLDEDKITICENGKFRLV